MKHFLLAVFALGAVLIMNEKEQFSNAEIAKEIQTEVVYSNSLAQTIPPIKKPPIPPKRTDDACTLI